MVSHNFLVRLGGPTIGSCLINNIAKSAVRYEIGSFYIEVSAKMNLNIEKLFDEIANRLPKVQIKNENLKLIDNPTPVDDKCRC